MLQIRENVKDFRTGPSGPMHDDTSPIGPMQANASKNLSSILINPCKHRGLRCEKNLWISIASLPWASRSGPCACSCPNVERADDVLPPLTGKRAMHGVLIQKTDRQAQERARVRIGPVRIGCVERNNPRSAASQSAFIRRGWTSAADASSSPCHGPWHPLPMPCQRVPMYAHASTQRVQSKRHRLARAFVRTLRP